MAELDNLEYFLKFPKQGFCYNQIDDNDFVFVVNEKKVPVILLFGWAGCKDKYLAKYSEIYERKGYGFGQRVCEPNYPIVLVFAPLKLNYYSRCYSFERLITLRYIAPVKCLFWKRYQMITIAENLVKFLIDLNFDNNPIIVHCFSNGGAFMYQNFSLALNKSPKPLQIKGVIFDSAPGRRRIISLYRAISAILQGNVFYNVFMSFIMTMFLSTIWIYEVISNCINPRPNFQSNPLENLKYEKNKWPQLFIYSKNDNLIPHTDIEYFADFRKKMGVDVTTICYDTSLHVKHLPENRQSYMKSVYNFINKCLNGKN